MKANLPSCLHRRVHRRKIKLPPDPFLTATNAHTFLLSNETFGKWCWVNVTWFYKYSATTFHFTSYLFVLINIIGDVSKLTRVFTLDGKTVNASKYTTSQRPLSFRPSCLLASFLFIDFFNTSMEFMKYIILTSCKNLTLFYLFHHLLNHFKFLLVFVETLFDWIYTNKNKIINKRLQS